LDKTAVMLVIIYALRVLVEVEPRLRKRLLSLFSVARNIPLLLRIRSNVSVGNISKHVRLSRNSRVSFFIRASMRL